MLNVITLSVIQLNVVASYYSPNLTDFWKIKMECLSVFLYFYSL